MAWAMRSIVSADMLPAFMRSCSVCGVMPIFSAISRCVL